MPSGAPVMPMEFQAVVMAAGKGSRMSDVTAGCPKALLPVGNFPLLWYPVNMLERAGFEEAIVVVLESFYEDARTALCDVCKVKIQLDFVPIPDNEFWGTADSLRHIKDKITTDLLVVSCDLLTDVKLQKLANVHRTHGASITMMLSSLTEPFLSAAPPGLKGEKKKDKDMVALDKHRERVLYIKPLADFVDKEDFTWQASMRKMYPHMYMGSKLTDCHLYLMKKWVLDYICDKDIAEAKKISSIKSDLIPHVIKSQFLKPETTASDEEEDDFDTVTELSVESGILDYAKDDFLKTRLVRDLSFHLSGNGCGTGNGVGVYAFKQEEGFVVRVNTLGTYCQANRQILKFFGSPEIDTVVTPGYRSASPKDKIQVGQDCLVGDSTMICSSTSAKKSIIGKHCHIGENVKINNSIIMDHVHIGDGCSIQGSLVCADVTLEAKSDIKDSVVGHHQKLRAHCKLVNELVCDVEGMMQL